MPLCTFEFHCPRGTDANAQITIKFIIEQVIKKKCPEATLVNIRRGIHLETYGPAGILVKHPKGEHISGEYFHPKEKMWYNFHIYVCKNNKGKWIMNPQCVDLNPEYFEPSIKPAAKALRKGDRKEEVNI